jgi:hypothetical protein
LRGAYLTWRFSPVRSHDGGAPRILHVPRRRVPRLAAQSARRGLPQRAPDWLGRGTHAERTSRQILGKNSFKGAIHILQTFGYVIFKPNRSPLLPMQLKLDRVISIFYQPLKTSAADILSMLKDSANGGRSRFLGAHFF